MSNRKAQQNWKEEKKKRRNRKSRREGEKDIKGKTPPPRRIIGSVIGEVLIREGYE